MPNHLKFRKVTCYQFFQYTFAEKVGKEPDSCNAPGKEEQNKIKELEQRIFHLEKELYRASVLRQVASTAFDENYKRKMQ